MRLKNLLRQSRVGRIIYARPRLLLAAAVGVTVGLLVPVSVTSHLVARVLIGWNAGTCLYIAMAAVMMIRSSPGHMRQRAHTQDEGALVILCLVVIAAVASLIAIAAELTVVKDVHGLVKTAHVALAGLTVLSSWAFIQIMFALHYAHEYYVMQQAGCDPGLQFVNDTAPDYGDFFYASAIIGTSGQTADVSFSSKPMRRLGSLHCILSYLFNTTVLALLVNIGAGLF